MTDLLKAMLSGLGQHHQEVVSYLVHNAILVEVLFLYVIGKDVIKGIYKLGHWFGQRRK